MSVVTTHQRPGVYSAYTVSTVVSGGAKNGTAAIAAMSEGGEAGELYTITSYQEAETAFGKGDTLTELCKLLLVNGAARVLAVPMTEDWEYTEVFPLLEAAEDVTVMLCDSADNGVQTALVSSVEAASQERRERIAVLFGAASETTTQLVQRAARLNSERAVLVAPAALATSGGNVLAAAAVAGAICAENDPALPLGGATVRGLTGLAASYSESEVDTLIQGGVTPLESVGGKISVIRAVTTRTTTGGAADETWRDLSTIRVVDHVMQTLRTSLRARFSRSKNTGQVRSAIRSQVILDLERKCTQEIITGYDQVTVQALEDTPSVCLVTFHFTVAHGLNQIWLKAEIRV